MRRSLVVVVSVICVLGCERSAGPPVGEVPAVQPEDTTFFQEAVWSPDGRTLALSRLDIHADYRASIAVLRSDGSGYRAVTSGPRDMWCTWSPDASSLAYGSRRNENQDIYVKDLASDTEIRLTTDPADDTHPDWSPDGRHILFVSDRDGVPQVYAITLDGSDTRKLTDEPGEKWNPRWSPDGQQLTYYGAVEQGRDSVYVLTLGDARSVALTSGIWPSWSPDGSRILFVDEDNLYEIGTDGSSRNRILDDVVIARWSPAGNQIAFSRVTWRAPSGWPAIADVFVANDDGSGIVRLTGSE